MANKLRQKGQALVEAALFLPIFIVLLGGVVEVSQLTVSKNRVTSATRASTRFGAGGGENEGMVAIFHSSITQTMPITETRWDMWVFRAKINPLGDGFDKWDLEHTYGVSNTVKSAEFDADNLQAQILEELMVNHEGMALSRANLSDLEIIGTYLIFDADSLLGLNGFEMVQGLHSVASLNVMPITSTVEDTQGCTGFPIAVRRDVRSVTPPGEGANPYPDDFDYPDPYPNYESFFTHTENLPLDRNTPEGTLFKVQNGTGSGNFGWLAWNTGIASSAPALENSLTWPGNGADYSDHGDGGQPLEGFPHVVRGYVEPGDSTDTSMHIGDWVAGSTGSVNASNVRAQLEEMVERERHVRLLLWDDTEGTGNNTNYHISGFAVFKLIGYRLSQGGGQSGGESWILAQFIRWDDSCGQVLDTANP